MKIPCIPNFVSHKWEVAGSYYLDNIGDFKVCKRCRLRKERTRKGIIIIQNNSMNTKEKELIMKIDRIIRLHGGEYPVLTELEILKKDVKVAIRTAGKKREVECGNANIGGNVALHYRGGCKKKILMEDAYRCTGCSGWFHKDCILEHFKLEKNHDWGRKEERKNIDQEIRTAVEVREKEIVKGIMDQRISFVGKDLYLEGYHKAINNILKLMSKEILSKMGIALKGEEGKK